MTKNDRDTVLHAWINASLELAAVMEEQGITRLAPTLSTGSGKDAELSLKIITPEGAEEDWEMDSFWEDDNEEAA